MTYGEWLLNTIRAKGFLSSWLEEYRFEIESIFSKMLSHIEDGFCVLVLTDHKRDWLNAYIKSHINDDSERPMLPFINLNNIINEQKINNDNISYIDDFLELTFAKHIVWYIGDINEQTSSILQRGNNNFIWSIGKELTNSINFSKDDEHLDVKLIELFSILNKSISGIIYGEFEVN